MESLGKVVHANPSSGLVAVCDDVGACAVLELVKGEIPAIGSQIVGDMNSVGMVDLMLNGTSPLSVFVHAFDCSLSAVYEEVR